MGARKDQSISYSRLTQEEVEAFCVQWGIDLRFKPEAPSLDTSIDQCPAFSFGQLHPQGLARVLHFEILCRAVGYDPSLLAFRHFFRLTKNGDWFTFETSQVDTCLISSMSIVPFKMIWRHLDVVLNELEPSDSELDSWFF
ncbi:hypothetical protein Hanom_Chr14g01252971 [Helianthus anomalus]